MSSALMLMGAKVIGKFAIKAFLKRLDASVSEQEKKSDAKDICKSATIANARLFMTRIQEQLPKYTSYILEHPELQKEVRLGLVRLCREMEFLPDIVDQEGFETRLSVWVQTLQLIVQELEHPEGEMSVRQIRTLLANYFSFYPSIFDIIEEGNHMSEIKETKGIYPQVEIKEANLDQDIAKHFKEEMNRGEEVSREHVTEEFGEYIPTSSGFKDVNFDTSSDDIYTVMKQAGVLLEEFIVELGKVSTNHDPDMITIPKRLLGMVGRSTIYRLFIQQKYQAK